MTTSHIKRRISAWLLIACGVWLIGLGVYFIAVRPPLLPEDLRYMHVTLTLIRAAGLSVRDALRQKGTPYMQLGLDDPSLSEDHVLDAMLAHPILINRPFVETAMGVRLCRPSELVLDILPPVTRPFSKEDGEVVIDEFGRRVR